MNTSVRTKIIKVGNSKGVRIPRALLEQAGLVDEVELSVEEQRLIIQPVHRGRQGWAAAFQNMAAAGDDALLDAVTPTDWDDQEWTW